MSRRYAQLCISPSICLRRASDGAFRPGVGGNGFIFLAVELTSELGFREPAPLFEIERKVGGCALIAKRDDPLFLHRTSSGPALAANDDPVDAIEADCPEVFEKRLTGQEAHRDVTLLETLQTRQTVSFVLHGHTPPNVRQAGRKLEIVLENLAHPLEVLCKDLVGRGQLELGQSE